MDCVFYVHGRGGSAGECRHYIPLFPGCEVTGIDLKASVPWEAGREIRDALGAIRDRCDSVILVAVSIGAYFSMCAEIGDLIARAYFVSPIVDMEKLIGGMMARAGVSESELRKKRLIQTASGETLSWEYLRYVRSHPLHWNVPTRILMGENDVFTDAETMRAFAQAHGAPLCVMKNAEHWFHTEEQMRFLDEWIGNGEAEYLKDRGRPK